MDKSWIFKQPLVLWIQSDFDSKISILKCL
jgi:hypothetical protein